jgi:hypothetical protein
VAAAELAPWFGGKEKSTPSGEPPDRIPPTNKGALRITGAVNVVEQEAPSRSHSPSWDVSFGRRCGVRNLIGCNGDHVLLQCDKLMSMKLGERKEVLEKIGLCRFCLKHAAELEYYGRGRLSKPRCTQAGCDGEHTPGVHKLMGEKCADVNLVVEDRSGLGEDEDEDEDEECWVGTVGAVEETQGGVVRSEPGEETHLATREGDSGLEEEPEYPLDINSTDGWWSPEPPQSSPEEDEEEAQYLMRAWDSRSQGKKPPQNKATGDLREKVMAPDEFWKEQSSRPRGAKRRKLRRRVEKTRDQKWEEARQDAWLRQMLSDTSSSEDEESCGRFA